MTLKTVQTETQDEQISAYHELLLTSLNIYVTAIRHVTPFTFSYPTLFYSSTTTIFLCLPISSPLARL